MRLAWTELHYHVLFVCLLLAYMHCHPSPSALFANAAMVSPAFEQGFLGSAIMRSCSGEQSMASGTRFLKQPLQCDVLT